MNFTYYFTNTNINIVSGRFRLGFPSHDLEPRFKPAEKAT